MRFLGFLFLSIVLTFGLTAYGYWLRIFVEIFDRLTEGQKGFGVIAFAFGTIGIIAALIGILLT